MESNLMEQKIKQLASDLLIANRRLMRSQDVAKLAEIIDLHNNDGRTPNQSANEVANYIWGK